MVCRFSQNGDLLWNRSIEAETINSVIEARDHDIIVAGSRLDHPYQGMVVNLDSAGNSVWQKTYGERKIASIGLILELPDRHELLAFATEKVSVDEKPGIFLLRLDESGTALDLTPFDQAGPYVYLRSVPSLVLSDTENLTVLYADVKNYNEPGYPLGITVNNSGSITGHTALWETNISSILTPDGGIFAGRISGKGNNSVLHLQEVNSEGIQVYNKTIITAFPDGYIPQISSVIRTSDGGYILLCQLNKKIET